MFLISIDYTLTSIQQEIEPLLPARGSMDGVYLLKRTIKFSKNKPANKKSSPKQDLSEEKFTGSR